MTADAKAWWQLTRRAWASARTDQVPLMAAGVAFFSFLSLFPAIIAAVLTMGLVVDPDEIRDQAKRLGMALPSSARDVLLEQVNALTSAPQRSLSIGLVISVAIAVWSASGGIGYLMSAVNRAYDEPEHRGFVRRKAIALSMTLAGMAVGVVALGLVAVAPAIFDAIGLGTATRALVELARWVLLVGLVLAGLAIVYRIGPERDASRPSWLSLGAVVAAGIWLVACLGFSFYVDNFGSYSRTYGSLAAVVILLLWLWITFYVVLLGAEINAEHARERSPKT